MKGGKNRIAQHADYGHNLRWQFISPLGNIIVFQMIYTLKANIHFSTFNTGNKKKLSN